MCILCGEYVDLFEYNFYFLYKGVSILLPSFSLTGCVSWLLHMQLSPRVGLHSIFLL